MAGKPGDSLILLCQGAMDLTIAAPYIKADALTVVLQNLSVEASLTCVTRWNPQDITTGASDAACRTIVLRRGGSFRLHPSLHAKYYRAGDSVLVGSANLTHPAMGWSPKSNLEILCHPGSDFNAVDFEQELLQRSRTINDNEFDRWQSIAVVGTPGQLHFNTATEHPLDDWRPTTRDPRNLGFSYRDRENLIASYDEQLAAARDIQSLLIPRTLNEHQLRDWLSTSLLTAPFTNSVIELLGVDSPAASRILAEYYGLSVIEARRDMESVQNWLRFFAPEILRGGS